MNWGRERKNPRNIFEAIAMARTSPLDEIADTFEPKEGDGFEPTDTTPGSKEKIDVLRGRLEAGVPLWHEEDKIISHSPGELSRLRSREGGKADPRSIMGYQRW